MAERVLDAGKKARRFLLIVERAAVEPDGGFSRRNQAGSFEDFWKDMHRRDHELANE